MSKNASEVPSLDDDASSSSPFPRPLPARSVSLSSKEEFNAIFRPLDSNPTSSSTTTALPRRKASLRLAKVPPVLPSVQSLMASATTSSSLTPTRISASSFSSSSSPASVLPLPPMSLLSPSELARIPTPSQISVSSMSYAHPSSNPHRIQNLPVQVTPQLTPPSSSLLPSRQRIQTFLHTFMEPSDSSRFSTHVSPISNPTDSSSETTPTRSSMKPAKNITPTTLTATSSPPTLSEPTVRSFWSYPSLKDAFQSFPSHSFFLFTPWNYVPSWSSLTSSPLLPFSECGVPSKTYQARVPSFLRPRHMFLGLFLFSLLLILVLPVLLYFVGSTGPQRDTLMQAALDQCQVQHVCQHSGVLLLDMDFQCACRCPPAYSGDQCQYETNCPCISSSFSNGSCLALYSPYSDLYKDEIQSFPQLSLDVVQLAMAFNLTDSSCSDQETLYHTLRSSAPSWAKLAVAHHFQASANYSAAKYLADKFKFQLSSGSYPLTELNGLIYDLNRKQITFPPWSSSSSSFSSSVNEKFATIAAMAKGLSQLRQTFFLLFWTKYLNLPVSLLMDFLKMATNQPFMLSFDSWKSINSSATLLDVFSSTGVYGSPFCFNPSTANFRDWNLAMEKAFDYPFFTSPSFALQHCLERPTLGEWNLWRLRTGNYPLRDKQQALVLDPSWKNMATLAAVPLTELQSKDQLGIPGAMYHVWIDYFWNFPKEQLDVKAMFLNYIQGLPVQEKPPLLQVHIWTSQQGLKFTKSHFSYAISSVFARVTSEGFAKDPFFGTASAQAFRTFLNQSGIPLYWSRDALQTQSYLDTNSTVLQSLWDRASKNEDMNEVWDSMTPKVQLLN